MQIIELEDLRNDIEGVLAKAQMGEVLICDHGTALAVVSKPKPPPDWAAYWAQREARLAGIVAAPGWDSTIAVSDDRDRA
jgi:antitoxin (DNA-binding transcriptional repressor) of toxin-antitoxin stability system